MKDNSRFVIAVHTLTLLAEKEQALASNFIGLSVGVNAVTIRKVVGQLRAAGLVETQTGAKGGTTLGRTPEKITLKEVYLAVRDDSVFGAYPEKPSSECTVGRRLQPTLTHLLGDAVQSMIDALDAITIADVLAGVLAPELP